VLYTEQPAIPFSGCLPPSDVMERSGSALDTRLNAGPQPFKSTSAPTGEYRKLSTGDELLGAPPERCAAERWRRRVADLETT
jgi:hypothetical protein